MIVLKVDALEIVFERNQEQKNTKNKQEVRSQNTEVRIQNTEYRNQKPEVRSQKTEVRMLEEVMCKTQPYHATRVELPI